MKNFDKIDHKLVEYLQNDGRITNAQLSEHVGLSPASTLERVRKLENLGVLKGYHAQVDYKKLGLSLQVWIGLTRITPNESDEESFLEWLSKSPCILHYEHVTGGIDFLVTGVYEDIHSYIFWKQKLQMQHTNFRITQEFFG